MRNIKQGVKILTLLATVGCTGDAPPPQDAPAWRVTLEAVESAGTMECEFPLHFTIAPDTFGHMDCNVISQPNFWSLRCRLEAGGYIREEIIVESGRAVWRMQEREGWCQMIYTAAVQR